MATMLSWTVWTGAPISLGSDDCCRVGARSSKRAKAQETVYSLISGPRIQREHSSQHRLGQ
jgi:hypothetical protein